MKKLISFTFFILLLSQSLIAQKIKYADIFPDLEAENYNTAEPKLRSFLSDAKNLEHANANFQMAKLLALKVKDLNIVKDSSAFIKYMDSVRTYFFNAKRLINDKEVKKRDEYYQFYYRRDLRTGDFAIKVSDIHGDIEQAVEMAEKLKSGAVFLAVKLPQLHKSFEKSTILYKDLTDGFKSITNFALSVNEEDTKSLDLLAEQNANSKNIILEIQNKIASLPNIDFNTNDNILEIKNLDKDGLTHMDIYKGDFKIWGYESFVKEVIKKVDGDIKDYKEALISENKRLDQLFYSVKKMEGLSGLPEVSQDLLKQAEDIDPENIALSILKFKAEEINYYQTDLKEVEDLNHVYLQLNKFDSLNKSIKRAKIHFDALSEFNSDLEREKYMDFIIAAFNRVTQLEQFITDKKVWVDNRLYFIGKQTNELTEKSRWGVSMTDSIALFTEPEGQTVRNLTTYVGSDTTYFRVVGGFDILEKPFKAFLGRVDPGMNLLWKYSIQTTLETTESIAEVSSFDLIPAFKEYITCFFTENHKDYIFLALEKRSGTVKWKRKFSVEKPVMSVKFNDLTKELVIYLNDPENLAEGEELKYMVIDKSGKLRK